MTVLAYITDLFFQAKLGQAAQAAGATFKVVSSIYKFLPELEKHPSLVVIDLNAQGISPTSLIAQIKTRHPEVKLVAYSVDLETGAIQRARKAGADQVLSRSKVSSHFQELLASCS